MKWLLAFGVVVALSCTFGAGDALAQVNLHQPDTSAQGLLDLIQSNANTWNDRLHGYAVSLFWSLAVIQFVLTFFPLVIRNADFPEIVGELVKTILTLGFFAALLMYSAEWAQALIDSFRQAGAHAAGLPGKELQPGDMFATAVELANTVFNVRTFNPLTAVGIAVASAVVLLCFAFIAAFMFVTLVESYIVINASVLFMGFGALQWTREYAIAILRYAVSVGAKLFALTLIVGLIIQSARDWQAAYTHDDTSMLTMMGLSLVCAYLAKSIPDLIQGMIAGVSPSGGATIGSMAMAAVTAATAGAAAAAGGAAAAGTASGAARGPGGSGGLAGLIDSSLSGGANMARSAASGVDGTASVASTLTPRVGGAPAAPPARSGGMNGSGPSAAGTAGAAANAGEARGPDRGTAQAARQAASGASGGVAVGETPAAAQSAPTAPGNGPTAAPSAPTGKAGYQTAGPTPAAGIGGHQAASGIVRTAGVLAALSVPGMEGAAGLSLGPPPPPTGGSDGGSKEPGAEFRQSPAPDNTISPAAPPVAPSASPPPSSAPGTPPRPSAQPPQKEQ